MLDLSALNQFSPVHPHVSPTERMAKLVAIQNAQLEGQQRQGELTDAETKRRQGVAIQKALIDAGGDIEKAMPAILQAAPDLAPHYQKFVDDQRTTTTNRELKAREVATENANLLQGQDLPHATVNMADATPMAYPGQIGEGPSLEGGTDVRGATFQPQQIPGVPSLGVPAVQVTPKTLWQQLRQKDIDRQQKLEDEITLKREQQKAELEFNTTQRQTIPVDQQELADYLKKNPGKGPADFAAWKAAQTRPPKSDDARMDRSYQYNDSALTKTGEPISQAVARFGRLQDTINQATPQADALIAPELMTVMAGGIGSGLRINEAEIARVIGGRSNLESLKAALNKWQLDPSKALSVTPAQRQQIRALMDEVNKKLLAKQQIIEDSRQQLIRGETVEDHRKIVADAKAMLNSIDQGIASAPAARPIVQQNKATGAFRYSTDGGKTWRNGQPPQ